MANRPVFVIVPAFNESRVLRETVAPLVEAGYSVVVVDDGSGDAPAVALEGLRVGLLRHCMNLGQGAALQTGAEYALRQGAEIIVHFDADGQHPVGGIPAMIRPILEGRADVVLGSRFLRREDAMRVPLARRFVLRIGIVVSALFSGLWLTDTHNGFRALSRRAMLCIHLRENGFAHATEILQQIRRTGLRHVEVPTGIRYSTYSLEKGQRLWNSFRIVLDLALAKLLR